MNDLDLSISRKGIQLLKSLFNQQLVSFRFEITKSNVVFEKIEIKTSTGRYLIDNDVDWFDDYFSGTGDIPFLDFKELTADENPFKTWPENATETHLINEKIENILIVQDDGDIYKDGIYFQHMTSSDGIIFVTDKAQYGFFKENMYLDEEVEFFKDEKDVLSKAKSLKEHYNIFGYPFSGKCNRSIISLKDGTIKKIDSAEEEGEL